MKSRMRRRVYVDQEVQGALVRYMVQSWLMSFAAIGGLSLLGWMFLYPGLSAFVGPEAFMREVLPMLVTSMAAGLLVLPILLWRLVVISHRFAGPIVRLKRVMGEVAEGAPAEPVHFRRDDFWQDLAESYNAMLNRLQSEMDFTAQPEAGETQEATSRSTPLVVPGAAMAQPWPAGHGVEMTA